MVQIRPSEPKVRSWGKFAPSTQPLASEVKAPLAILRPTLIYGEKDPHNGYGPNQFRRKANKGEAITLFGEGEERRDHVAIDDVRGMRQRLVGVKKSGGPFADLRVMKAVDAVRPRGGRDERRLDQTLKIDCQVVMAGS